MDICTYRAVIGMFNCCLAKTPTKKVKTLYPRSISPLRGGTTLTLILIWITYLLSTLVLIQVENALRQKPSESSKRPECPCIHSQSMYHTSGEHYSTNFLSSCYNISPGNPWMCATVWNPARIWNTFMKMSTGNRTGNKILKFAQWNAGSAFLANKVHHIQAEIERFKPDLLGITEANLRSRIPDHEVRIDGNSLIKPL